MSGGIALAPTLHQGCFYFIMTTKHKILVKSVPEFVSNSVSGVIVTVDTDEEILLNVIHALTTKIIHILLNCSIFCQFLFAR